MDRFLKHRFLPPVLLLNWVCFPFLRHLGGFGLKSVSFSQQSSKCGPGADSIGVTWDLLEMQILRLSCWSAESETLWVLFPTLWFAGQRSVHWATPARAQPPFWYGFQMRLGHHYSQWKFSSQPYIKELVGGVIHNCGLISSNFFKAKIARLYTHTYVCIYVYIYTHIYISSPEDMFIDFRERRRGGERERETSISRLLHTPHWRIEPKIARRLS